MGRMNNDERALYSLSDGQRLDLASRLPLSTLAESGLLTRGMWERYAGARYPGNRHEWEERGGKPFYLGPRVGLIHKLRGDSSNQNHSAGVVAHQQNGGGDVR